MDALKRIAACLLLALLAGGCSTNKESWAVGGSGTGEPETHKVRTLKRLVLLPPAYEVDSSVAKGWSQAAAERDLLNETIDYLRDWKGYLVTQALSVDSALAPRELRLRLLAHLAAKPPGTPLPGNLAAEVRGLAERQGADGIAVLGARFEGLTAERWAQIYAVALVTIGVGQYAILAKVGTYFDAAIFDGATGSLVWWARNKKDYPEPLDPAKAGQSAFDALPNALTDAQLDDHKVAR